MNTTEINTIRARARRILKQAGIMITRQEATAMEVVDFGLNDLRRIGLEIVVYENNDRYCAKELVLLPRQTCAEHRHPALSSTNPGKRETFRCRWGKVYLYVEGPPTRNPHARIPEPYRPWFTVWREIVLRPGEQFTVDANTLHWFQGGATGAVVSEFSSTSVDESDFFTDPNISRIPALE